MMRIMRWWVTAIVVLGVLGAGAWFYWRVARRIEYPKETKIMSVAGASQKASWEAPAGRMFSMLLGTTGPAEKLRELRGTLRLWDGKTVIFERAFGSDDLQQANWLDHDGRASVIIGKGADRLDEVIGRRWVFDVELQLDQAPDFPVELWCSWLTSPSIEDEVVEVRRKQEK